MQETAQIKPRTTKTERRKRVNQVAEWLLNGLTTAEILQLIADQTKWNISERQIFNYISKADTLNKTITDEDYSEKVSIAEKRIMWLYKRAITAKSWGLARRLNEDYRKLFGLDMPEKHRLTNDLGKDLGVVVLPAIDFEKIGKAMGLAEVLEEQSNGT